MGERLKQLRRHPNINLTQSDFANKIGASQQTIAMFENGTRQMSERYIKAICSVFGVNEEWLRDGDGEIFIISEKSIIDEFMNEYKLNEDDRKIIEAYTELPEEARNNVKEYLLRLAASFAVPAAPKPNIKKTQILKFANSKDNKVKPSIEMVDEKEIDSLFELPDTDQE